MSTPEPKPAAESAKFRLAPRQIAAGALAVLALIFIIQNRSSTTIQFITVDVEMPVWIALLVVIVVGFLIGYLVHARRGRAKARHTR